MNEKLSALRIRLEEFPDLYPVLKESQICIHKKDTKGFDVTIAVRGEKYVVSWGPLSHEFTSSDEAFGCFMIALTKSARLSLLEIEGVLYEMTSETKEGREWYIEKGRSKWWSPKVWKKNKPTVLKNNHLAYSGGKFTSPNQDRHQFESLSVQLFEELLSRIDSKEGDREDFDVTTSFLSSNNCDADAFIADVQKIGFFSDFELLANRIEVQKRVRQLNEDMS